MDEQQREETYEFENKVLRPLHATLEATGVKPYLIVGMHLDAAFFHQNRDNLAEAGGLLTAIAMQDPEVAKMIMAVSMRLSEHYARNGTETIQ